MELSKVVIGAVAGIAGALVGSLGYRHLHERREARRTTNAYYAQQGWQRSLRGGSRRTKRRAA